VNVTVDIMKVKHSLVSLCGGDCLDVDLEIGVKPFIHEKWGDIRGRVCGIVVCKLCEREEEHPIILEVVYVDSQILLKYLVEALSLAISLGVISH
jgi:hypothetical protein